MSWQQYVDAVKALGFQRVAIIARTNYQTVGTTNAQTDIATAWKDGDTQINENQELLDDWKDTNKKCFCFFGKKYNIIQRFEEDAGYSALVCASGNDICVVAEFKTIWFVAFGIKKKLLDKDAKGGGFSGAQQAYGKITKDVWDALGDAGM